jgi:hypothetical protein
MRLLRTRGGTLLTAALAGDFDEPVRTGMPLCTKRLCLALSAGGLYRRLVTYRQ